MISAGKESDVTWDNGNWIFLDIGFSNKGRTCGLAFADESPQKLTFGTAARSIVDSLRNRNGLINLVIEAPLSVSFDKNGNPKGRKIEKRDSDTRYWYAGLGCAVMTAAMYLIRDIHEATKDLPNIQVRLFEGFVSFKEMGTDDRDDVCALREKVRNALEHQKSILGPDELITSEDDEICSAFRVAGLDFGVPAVIIA
jgi:hypothetical protein